MNTDILKNSASNNREIDTDSLKIYGNCLEFKDTVIQLSNVSLVANSLPTVPKFPLWSIAALLLGFACLFANGISGTAYSDVTQQLVAAANIKPEDVAFSVSYEGRSRNVVEAMKIAKERGAVTICITKMNKSPLLHYVDIALFISVSDLTIGREKVARRVADQAILDALFVGMSIRMGKEAIKKRQDIHKVMEINKIRKKS